MSTNMQTGASRQRVNANVGQNDVLFRDMSQYARQQVADAKMNKAEARTNALRQNAALPDNSWQSVDDTVYGTEEDVLRLVADLEAAGLRAPIDIQAKTDSWRTIDDEGSASVDMDPETATEESTVGYGMDGTVVPIIHDDFSLGFRESPAAGEEAGESLDTLGPTVASRHVNEAIEQMFLSPTESITINSPNDTFTLYGLTDHPATATGTTTADWTVDNTAVRGDVRAMRGILKNDRQFSPGNAGYWLYLGTSYYDILDDVDPAGDGNLTVRDRVENLSNISRIRELEFLPEKSALMFRPTADVIEVGVASELQAVQWEDPFRDYWKVLAAKYPRIKQTRAGDSGVVYWTA